MKKLIPALCMLLVSALLMGTSTYAWFSMNNKVTVTGMTINTKVSNNLMIAATSVGNDKVADAAFNSGYNQVVTGTMQPSSTDDGINYFYTYDAGADGAILTGKTYTAVPGTGIITVSAVEYKAYVDYVFEVKAINAGASPAYVNLSRVNLLYMGSAVTEHGYRVAVFVQQQATPSATLAATAVADAYADISTTSANAILGWDATGANYQTTKSGVNGTANGAVGTVANYGTATALEVEAGKTQYFKFTVRLWLEGEDKDCKNDTYMPLTNDWRLDLALTLDDANTSAVTTISTVGSAAATTTAAATGAVTLTTGAITNGETAESYQWYKVVDGAADTIATGASTGNTYTATTDGKYYCVVTTTKGNTYATNVVDLDA